MIVINKDSIILIKMNQPRHDNDIDQWQNFSTSSDRKGLKSPVNKISLPNFTYLLSAINMISFNPPLIKYLSNIIKVKKYFLHTSNN